ncbi:MAG: PAS domain S-box protein, partial [Gallionellaceae bacterium]|nr:PAS domain S-box protein [Gallionellaceae bacterium]
LNILDEMFGETSVVFYIAATDGDFPLHHVGRNIGRILGISPEACTNSADFWRKRIHPEDAEEFFRIFSGVSSSASAVHEFRFRDDAGNYRWVRNEVALRHAPDMSGSYLAGCLRDISDEKKHSDDMAGRLKEHGAKEHFYRSVLDNMPQRLFWKDINSVFRGCNLSGARALNLSSTSEIIGKTDYDFYASREEADYLRISDEQVMLSGQVSRQTGVPGKNGNAWLDVTKVPLRNEKGEIYGLLVSYEDVSALKKSEMALAESESCLREITSTVGEGIYVIDEKSLITFVNPAAEKLFGMSEKELLGQDVRHILHCHQCLKQHVHGNNVPGICRFFLGAHHSGNTIRAEDEYFIRGDGTQFPVSIVATPILREERYAGAVIAFHDITERKFTQRLLNDTLQELRTVLDNAQIGVAYLREDRFFWINKHMEQMFGYTAGDLQGKPIEAIYTATDDAEETRSQLAGGTVYENERLMKRCSGEVFWCHQRGVAISPGDPGKGSIWIMLDIDRLKKSEHDLKALNETLAQRVEEETQKSLERERLLIQQGRSAAMGEMIGNIAHQWRQPLSTLGVVVQNIQSDYKEKMLGESALENYVGTAMRAIQQMSGTIDDFRDFFRPNRAMERFPVYPSIHGTMQLVDAMLKNNRINIRLSGDQNLTAFGYPNEFSQAVLNVIANAKDVLVERKVPHGHIDIELSTANGWGVISIRDNAGGIPEGAMEKIFDPYFTTKPNGTGIGLYMSKIIIEKHMGGRISCCNNQGGAEFTLNLPLPADASAPITCEVNNE